MLFKHHPKSNFEKKKKNLIFFSPCYEVYYDKFQGVFKIA